MPYLRRLPPIPLNGSVTARVTVAQRDLLLTMATLPKELGHMLARSAVRSGKLNLKLKREGLDRLIMVAAATRAPGKTTDRELVRLLNYLESLADRFERADEEPSSLAD